MVKDSKRKRSDWRTSPRDEFWGRVRDDRGEVVTKNGEPVYQHLGWVQYLASQYPRGLDFRPVIEDQAHNAGHIHRSQDDMQWTKAFKDFTQATTREPYSTWRRAHEPQHLWSEVRDAIDRARRRDVDAVKALEYYQGKFRGELTREGFMQREHIASSQTLTQRMYRGASLVLDELERVRGMQ